MLKLSALILIRFNDKDQKQDKSFKLALSKSLRIDISVPVWSSSF